jgi:hypothetical protein
MAILTNRFGAPMLLGGHLLSFGAVPILPILTVLSVSPLVEGASTTVALSFSKGAPTGFTAKSDGAALAVIGSPTITTLSGSGATAAGTASFHVIAPAAGTHSLVVQSLGTFGTQSPAFGFTTSSSSSGDIVTGDSTLGTLKVLAPPPGAAADGFNTPGIYGPPTVYGDLSDGSGSQFGSWFVRGLAGPATWTLSGTDASIFTMSIQTANQLANGGLFYGAQKSSYAVTLNATDGTTTYTKDVTVQAASGYPQITNTYLLNTQPGGSFSPPSPNAIIVAQISRAAVMTSSDGAMILGNGATTLYTTEAVFPTSSHYGEHDITFTANSTSLPVGVWFIEELSPAVSFVQSNILYDNSPISEVFGQVNASSDGGIASYAITSADGSLSVGPTGTVTVIAAPTAGASQVITVTVTSNYGIATTLTIPYVVSVGTSLPASNMTADFSTSLDNSMTNVVVGTVTVTGITNPLFTVTGLSDDFQDLIDFNNIPTPRYSVSVSGNVATVSAAYLSAQTDQVTFSAFDTAGVRCVNTFSVTAADVCATGPAITITPGATATATVFPTWNAALDAYWTTPATYMGMTLTLPGGVYAASQTDFNRPTIGHGSNQQFPPGPMILKGPSPSNPAVLSIKGAPFESAQGGLGAVNWDITFANLCIRDVSDLSAGEGNAGGILKVGNQCGNITMQDIKLYNSDNGFLSGFGQGVHVVMERVVLAFCGLGAGNLTHNAYVGHDSSVLVDNVLSFATAQVHDLKLRAANGTVQNSMLVDGENGAPGSSACLDIPDGGAYVVTNTIFMKGPCPNNDGDMVQFCAEPENGGPNELWPVNTLLLDGCTFIATAAPGSFTSAVYGIRNYARNDGSPNISPTTGLPATVIYRNCKFYNLPKSQWAVTVNPINTITDGGGNVAITTWPQDILAIDPSTGSLLTVIPGPSYASPVWQAAPNNQGICIDPLALQLRIAVGAPIGTHVTTFFPYDQSGVLLTSQAWTLPANQVNVGNFAINATTGELTVASASIPDSLVWALAECTGIDYLGRTQTFTKYVFVVVGDGTMPALP